MRRHALPLAAVVFVATLPFAGALAKREVFTFRDHSDYFQPLRYYTALHLRVWRLPLWNPYNGSGEPWMANPQTGCFYPPTWLFIPLPFDVAYMLYLLFHIALLGVTSYMLFVRNASRSAALLGAVAMMLAGPTLSLLDVSNNLATFAWLPLVLWCALERVSWRTSALVIALSFLAGEPFFAAIGALLFAIIVGRRVIPSGARDLDAQRRSRDEIPRELGMTPWREIALVGAGAFALSSIQLLPFLELLRGSNRGVGLQWDEVLRDSMRFGDWLRLAIQGPTSQQFIFNVYVGLIVVLLATAGVAQTFLSARRQTGMSVAHALAWMALLVIAVLLAAGAYFPPTAALIRALPVTLFRYPARLVPFGAFAVIALAVLGWDRIRARLPRRVIFDVLVVGVLVFDLMRASAPLLVSAPFSIKRTPYHAGVGTDGKFLRFSSRIAQRRQAWIAGYLNLFERRFDASTPAPLSSNRYEILLTMCQVTPRYDLMDFLPAKWILHDAWMPRRFEKAESAGRVTAYRNPQALPMASFWTRALPAANDTQAFRDMIDGKIRGQIAVTPRVGANIANAELQIHAPEALALDAKHARAVVHAPADGIFLLTQRDAPGWRVEVDGERGEPLLANGIFRAVALSPGRHTILWTYSPASFFIGAAITICALVAMQLARLSSTRGDKKSSSLSTRGQV